ncbi:hypothetical protein [Streptomyces sp. C10-9-1]|uniref:hypothetical protein n=1 Tax=Streptomyces sp. C10-9-1 TaxID=1859285 RepID=UPI003D7031D7
MMPGPYVAEVFAGDAVRTVYLGGSVTTTRRLALRWLRGQALRFANALDPSPYAEWLPPEVLQPVTHTASDAPTELRAWARNNEHQDDALRQLTAGSSYEFRARDDACWYALTARPVVTRSPTTLRKVPAHA